jgi:hypothetical protein
MKKCAYCGKEMELVHWHGMLFWECTDCDCWEEYE